jgi:hypothetical protein
MSSYTKPLDIGAGTLYTDSLDTLEDSTRKYANDQIVDADIGTNLTGLNIAKGAYNPINNTHKFTTGEIGQTTDLWKLNNYTYQTSTTKNNIQTASIQYQDIANAGVTLATAGGTAVVTFYLYYEVSNNPTTHTATNDGPGNGQWYNQIVLKTINQNDGSVTYYKTSTDNYVFAGLGGVVDTLDPGEGGDLASRRPVMVSHSFAISAGEWSFVASVNPHNEVGKAVVKCFSVEIFDI